MKSPSNPSSRTALKLAIVVLVVLGALVLVRALLHDDAGRTAAGAPPASNVVSDDAPVGDDPSLRDRGETARSAVGSEPGGAPAVAAPAADQQPCPEPRDRSHLRGRVVDEGGEAVSGASVEALRSPAAPRGAELAAVSTRSAADGGFELAVPDRTPLLLRASAPGFALAWKSPVFGGEELTFVLRAGGLLEVVVADPDGAPVAGATVGVACMDATRTVAWQREFTTGEDGKAIFDDAPRARISAWARAAPFANALTIVDLTVASEARVQLTLGRGLRVRGLVVSAANATPLSGARVGCDALGYALTDAAGRYELGGIATSMSTWGIGAVLAEFQPTFRYVRIDETSGDVELNFELAPAPALRGRVVDRGGRPVPGTVVRASGQLPTMPFTGETLHLEARSDSSGTFTLAPIHTTGRWTLRFSGPTGERAEARAGPFSAGTAPIDLGDIVLEAPAAIVGRVDGTVLANPSAARISLRPMTRSGDFVQRVSATTTLDPWGAFRFDDLAPGRYGVELHGDDRGTELPPLAVQEVELTAGEREDVVLTPGRAWIEGLVVGPDGRPRSALQLSARDEHGRTVARGSVERDGTFKFAVPGDGEHVLLVRDPALRLEAELLEGVRPGERLRVQLRARVGGQRIEGFLRSQDAKPVEHVNVAFRNAETLEVVGRVAIPKSSGEFVMEGLEDSPYLVEVTDFEGRYAPEPPRLVRPGEGLVEIRLEPRP